MSAGIVSEAIQEYGKNFYKHLDMKKSDAFRLLTRLDAKYEEGKPLVDDDVYDVFRAYVNKTWPELSTKIGAPVKTASKFKQRLEVPMMSLDKIGPTSNLGKFANSSSYVVSAKMDGISLQITYDKGRIESVCTRGNGTVGENVTALAPALNVPQKIKEKSRFIVRFEFVMKARSFKAFDKDGGGEFTTARNMAGGVINRNKPSPMVSKFDVVAFEIVKGKGAGSPLKSQLKLLDSLGFTVVDHVIVSKIDHDSLTALHAKLRKRSGYACDGITVTQNVSYTIKAENPKHSKAYKFNRIEDAISVKVLDVEWNASRHGRLQPRIRINPVTMGGVTVEYLSGKSFYFIQNGYTVEDMRKARKTGTKLTKSPINVGAVVRALRSGDVIPDIIAVVKPSPTPSVPAVAFELNADKTHAYATESKTDDVKIKNIVHFFSALGSEGIKAGVVTKLYAAGHSSLQKILKLSVDQILEVEGFKETSARKVYENIQVIYNNATAPRLAYALNVFGDSIGQSRLEALFDAYPNVEEMAATLTTAQLESRIQEVKGFKTLASILASGLPKFFKRAKSLRIPIIVQKKAKPLSSKLSQYKVLLTGVRDKELVEFIKANGGSEATSVKSATHLIVKDESTSNKKTEAASSLNIPVISLAKFRKKVGL